MTEIDTENPGTHQGQVVSVRGSVVDVRFLPPLPTRYRELRAGKHEEIVLEVRSLLDPERVRCIALTPAQRLARGAPVRDTGGPLNVPVDEALLGQMLNVFGETIDTDEPITNLQR